MKTKRLLFSTGTNHDLAQNIIKKTNIKLGKVDIGTFSNGETKVFLQEDVTGKHVYALGSTFTPNDNLFTLLLLINTLKVNGAKHITAIIPYYAYAKGDHLKVPGTSLTAKLIADYIKHAGADKIICINLHSTRVEKFLGKKLIHLDMTEKLAEEFKKIMPANMLVVSPDEGGLKRAKQFAKILKVKETACIKKYHPSLDKTNSRGIAGNVKNKNVVIFDDMVLSGATIITATQELKKAGAKEIYLVVIHIINTGLGIKRLTHEKRIKKVVYANTIPSQKRPNKFKAVDVSDLILKNLN